MGAVVVEFVVEFVVVVVVAEGRRKEVEGVGQSYGCYRSLLGGYEWVAEIDRIFSLSFFRKNCGSFSVGSRRERYYSFAASARILNSQSVQRVMD